MVALLVSLILLIAVMAALVFGPAGTVDYWQAWATLGGYFLASLLVSLWLLRHDRALLERRIKAGPFAEGEPSQKIIMTIVSLGFILILVVPGLDRRFGWSAMPDAVALVGDLMLLVGWAGMLAVFRANSFAAATIRVEQDQQVISTGPYAVVRHPMYAGGAVMLIGLPLGLGSWWGLVPFAAILPALAWRLLDEERVLRRDLPGYDDYCRTVRWRLLPLIW
jgi:protein-S-isoprenylcysteine O-methyltransferase Ste14